MVKITKLTLSILPEKFGICHFDEKTPLPAWVREKSSLISVTITNDELSVVCPQEKIPGGVLFEKDWRAFKLESIGDIYSVGIIASLAKPLAENGISVFNISTYETNYLLVEEKNLKKTKKVLSAFCSIKD